MTWVSSSHYTKEELERMQRDAEKRVREMQQRSRQMVEPSQAQQSYGQEENSQNQQAYAQPMGQWQQKPAPVRQSPAPSLFQLPGMNSGAQGSPLSAFTQKAGELLGTDGPIGKVMEALGIDDDKLLILAVLLILFNNKGDKKLMLALGYLLF